MVFAILFHSLLRCCFSVKKLAYGKTYQKNPFVLPSGDDAYALVGRYFKIILIVLFFYVFVFAFWDKAHRYFNPFFILNMIGLNILAWA
jgi:hypothetical protein